MKIGLIVEGIADGEVCELAATRLIPDIEVHPPETMTNRRLLIDNCGDTAAVLLTSHACDKVFIVWDLHPTWKEKGFKPCQRADRELILKSLKAAGLEGDPRVVPICITRELETWLITDATAITRVLERHNSPDRIQKINLPGKPARNPNPKGWLEKVFVQNARNRKYTDRPDAALILQNIADLKILKQIPSFKRFAEKLLNKSWP